MKAAQKSSCMVHPAGAALRHHMEPGNQTGGARELARLTPCWCRRAHGPGGPSVVGSVRGDEEGVVAPKGGKTLVTCIDSCSWGRGVGGWEFIGNPGESGLLNCWALP